MVKQTIRRRFRGGANAVVIGAAAVVVAILLNAVFSQVFWRVDMTTNQIYTLSQASHDAVNELEEPIEVRAFISPNMPPPYHVLDRQVEELLMEYRAASDGMVDFKILSPDDDEDVEELARGYGIEQVTIGQETSRSRSYREVYKGVAFIQGDRVESITDLRSSGRPELDSFEYEFTRALLNVVDAEPQRVAVLTNAGGPVDNPRAVDSMQAVFRETYGELLHVEPINIQETGEIPEYYSALVIWNIDGNVGEESLRAIDRFVQRGGNIGWFQSSGVIDVEAAAEQPQQVGRLRRPLESDLIDYFRTLGIHFGSDAVIDRERALAYGAVPTDRGMVRVSHPALFPITDMAYELPPVRHFSTLVIPIPSTLAIEQGALADGTESFEVLRTDETSTRLPSPPGRADYDELVQPIYGEEQGSFVIAAALQGVMPAHYLDQRSDEGEESRIFVVGSGDFTGTYAEVGYQGELSGLGLEFFLNTVEWLAQEHELAEVRGKSMPPLVADIPAEARKLMQIVNIGIVPAFFACLALFMFVRRQRRKRELSIE